MNNTIKYAFIFAAGAAVGAASVWQFLKKKYEQIAQEEIDSVKSVYATRYSSPEPIDDHTEAVDISKLATTSAYCEKPDLREYASIITGNSYSEKTPTASRPYVITPDEFGELDDYDNVSLTYYADGVLTDEYDEPMEDVDDVVGNDFASHFGEYEDDSVFIRNDRLRIDYEILRDERRYSDAFSMNPHHSEDE